MEQDRVRTTVGSAEDAARIRELERRVRALERERRDTGPGDSERSLRQLLESNSADSMRVNFWPIAEPFRAPTIATIGCCSSSSLPLA